MSAQLSTILMGVDLTAPSLAAARWVAGSLAPEARVILAHVLETSRIRRFLGAEGAGLAEDKVRRNLRTALDELRERIGKERADVILTEGSPGPQLAEIARSEDVDLIVLGGHRDRPGGSLLGSTLSNLLGATRTPVLVAHGLPSGEPRRIVAAVDESEAAPHVLGWARRLADRFDATGQVVFALEPPGIEVGTILFGSEAEYRGARAGVLERAQDWVREAADEAGLGSDRFEASAVYGHPEVEIAAAADGLDADLIVLGTRGHSHTRSLVLGSVARRVIESCGCPVLVVPPTDPGGDGPSS